MDRSCCGCGLDMPKPIEGVIFSHPCLAWPVKFEILCISEKVAAHRQPYGIWQWAIESECKNGELQSN